VAQLVDQYAALTALAPATSIAPTVTADPDDDHVLACALAAAADLIVSGDHALLNLKNYHGRPIVRPTEAVQRVFAMP